MNAEGNYRKYSELGDNRNPCRFPGVAVFCRLPMPFGYPALPGYPLNTTAAEPGARSLSMQACATAVLPLDGRCRASKDESVWRG